MRYPVGHYPQFARNANNVPVYQPGTQPGSQPGYQPGYYPGHQQQQEQQQHWGHQQTKH